MPSAPLPQTPFDALSVPFDKDRFLRSMLRELAHTLEDVVGLADAAGFISLIGRRIGDELNKSYRVALDVPKLNREQVTYALVDLKRRISGEFRVVEEHHDRIVYANTRCPFGDAVLDRPALCMMTSNVFGRVAADNLGYATVVLEQTIASGDAQCRVVVHLKRSAARDTASSREYFPA